MQNYHLVILKKPYLDAILSGQKTVESRFTKTRRPFFGRVGKGDEIFFKVSSGPVCATATIASVKSFENLTPQKIADTKDEYNHLICGSEEYWDSRADCKYGVLVWLKGVCATEPVRIDKKDWRAWMVLTEKSDFGLLKSCKKNK